MLFSFRLLLEDTYFLRPIMYCLQECSIWQIGQWTRFCWTHLRFALLAIWGRTCSILQCTARASITTHTTLDGRRHISEGVSTRYLTRDRNHPTLPDLDWMMIVKMTITSLRKIMIWEKTTEGAEAKTTLAMTKRTRNMVKSVYYPKTIWLNTRWYWQFHFLQNKNGCVG